MRILDLPGQSFREIPQFDSVGFSTAALGVLEPGHVAVLRLAPGGVIGRHPAVGGQLLVLLEGAATVSGAVGTSRDLSPGQAAWWEPGEEHETRSSEGMIALVVEGEWRRSPG